jgi:hypothetical protein
VIARPSPVEWNTFRLSSDRRAYLEANLSFEQIAFAALKEIGVTRARIIPYKDPPRSEPKGARQVVFVICIDNTACDLLFNAPDGLRGRYWQSPEEGSRATAYLIGEMLPQLLEYAEMNPPTPDKKAHPMDLRDIALSLRAPSAKIWPREKDDDDNSLFRLHELVVPRWEENEKCAEFNKAFWRRTPISGQIEIKGAILRPDGSETVPPAKLKRSYEIHTFGFV